MRRKPYTERGISRVPCAKCSKPSAYQWRICSFDRWCGICTKCDIDLNALVAKWAFGNAADKTVARYRKHVMETTP